jgi:hypothetical protein
MIKRHARLRHRLSVLSGSVDRRQKVALVIARPCSRRKGVGGFGDRLDRRVVLNGEQLGSPAGSRPDLVILNGGPSTTPIR